LPEYDYLYLGDNARAPYGTRSFDTVYRYTLECVQWLIKQDCPLVILACNTASAKALRTIQQNDLPKMNTNVRVLGVIRPTTEVIGEQTKTNTIGILATHGTVQSQSYLLEIEKFFPGMNIVQEACPMWVPLVENNEHNSEGADYFIKKHIDSVLTANPKVDTLLLACTHYPLLKGRIEKHLPSGVKLISQADIVAKSLSDYLQRHPEIESKITRNKKRVFHTTDSAEDFNSKASIFFGEDISADHTDLSGA
jgi:glutamate racemase